MEVKATRTPGQSGIRQLPKQYGAKFLCVRYRYVKTCQNRLNPTEIIADEKDWTPNKTSLLYKKAPVKVSIDETGYIERSRQSAAYRNPDKKARMFSCRSALQWRLECRVVDRS